MNSEQTAKKSPGKLIEYVIVRSIHTGLRLIPFRLRAWLTEYLGLSLYYLSGRYRRLILKHLEHAFPDRDPVWRRDIARRNFRNLGRQFSEFVQTAFINERFFRKWIVIKPDNDEHRDVFRQGSMGILGHLGNWEWHGWVAGYLAGRDIYTLVKRHTNFWSNRYLENMRNRAHMRQIYVDQNALTAVRRLREGCFVAFTSDQNARGNGEFFPYLGRLASTFLGPAVVARNTNVPVYFVWSYHDERKRLVFEFERLTRPPANDDAGEWEREFTLRWVQKLEEKIREHPADYLWAHNRWRTQPENPDEIWEFWRKRGVRC